MSTPTQTETDPTRGDADERDEEISLWTLSREAALLTVILVGAVFLAGHFLRDPLRTSAGWLVGQMGLPGMFVGIFAADAFTVPLPPDTYLFLGIAAGTDVALTVTVCSAASVIGGNVAYAVGPYIERIPLLRTKLEEFRPKGELVFDKWGGWTVSIAAMTPLPFSVVSWLAGIYKMSYPNFLLASFVRIPRIAGYYALYSLGWAPGLS